MRDGVGRQGQEARYVEAEPLWSACLETRRKLLPHEHPDIAFAKNALVKNRAAQSDVSKTPDETGEP